MQRLLAMVPWIAAHDGPTVDEVCARFGLTPAQLAADLEVMWLVGLPPYTPDALIDVVQEGDRVWMHYADVFDAPQRLTPDQAVALLTAGASVLALPGADPDGALATRRRQARGRAGGRCRPGPRRRPRRCRGGGARRAAPGRGRASARPPRLLLLRPRCRAPSATSTPTSSTLRTAASTCSATATWRRTSDASVSTGSRPPTAGRHVRRAGRAGGAGCVRTG